MLHHVVLMKFKPTVSAAEVSALKTALGRLPGLIAEIKGYAFGADVLQSERSYDFALVSKFDDLEAMQRYQAHNEHIPVVEKIKAMCTAIVAVDFETD